MGTNRFLFEKLNWSTTDCQLAGHLGVIFTISGVWEYNGMKRGIRFRKISNNWKDKIEGYYRSKSVSYID